VCARLLRRVRARPPLCYFRCGGGASCTRCRWCRYIIYCALALWPPAHFLLLSLQRANNSHTLCMCCLRSARAMRAPPQSFWHFLCIFAARWRKNNTFAGEIDRLETIHIIRSTAESLSFISSYFLKQWNMFIGLTFIQFELLHLDLALKCVFCGVPSCDVYFLNVRL
jgi:hypothetical protein